MSNPQGKNGKSVVVPPVAILRPHVEHYVASGYSNPEIINRLRANQNSGGRQAQCVVSHGCRLLKTFNCGAFDTLAN
ncbi:hypothetical protein BDR05DRAFT_959591, partial [Suillus weaverae]